MRNFLVYGLTLACLTLPIPAQETPAGVPATAPKLTRSQIDKQHALLHRLGTRLVELNEKQQVWQKLQNLISPEQSQAVRSLRINPTQLKKLIQLVQDNMPEGKFDKETWTDLRRKLTPQFEDILGSEQFDTLIELVPSPQQLDRMETVLKEAAESPEGVSAMQAAKELRAALTAEQRRYLDPILDMVKDSTAPPPSVPAFIASKLEDPRRVLVLLKKDAIGDVYAEINPDFDYLRELPRYYRVTGADPTILSAVSTDTGIPVRMLGQLGEDTLKVDGGRLIGLPPILPVDATLKAWHGRLPARLVSTSPPIVTLDAGRGQSLTAQLDMNSRESKEFAVMAAQSKEFLVTGTCMAAADKATLVDVEFAPLQVQHPSYTAAGLLQLSEEFLWHAAEEYLAGHQKELHFQDKSGLASIEVSDIGVTVENAAEPKLKLYGSVAASHSGLKFFLGQFSVVVKPAFVQDKLQLAPVPGSLEVGVYFPLFAQVPKSWLATVETIAGPEYAKGISLPVPEGQRKQILDSGLLAAEQIDNLKLFTSAYGDRRTSLVAIGAPATDTNTTATDPLQSRIQAPAEFAVSMTDEAVTAALRRKVPTMLPIVRPVPKDKQMQEGVRFTEIELPELDLSYEKGLFHINNCLVAVHWSWGLFSGVEQGARIKGTAAVEGSGDPMVLKARLKVESVDFVSERVLSQTPEEQKRLKESLIKMMEENPIELMTVDPVAVDVLSPRAMLAATTLKGNLKPAELLLQGLLKP